MLSVHLQNFPKLTNIVVNKDIVNKMDLVRDICNSVFSLRKEANIRVRMPLNKITLCGKFELKEDYINLIKQEVNVKNVEIYSNDINEIATKKIVLDMKECGKQFGSKLKDILLAQKQGNWKIENNKLKIADVVIDNSLFHINFEPKDGSKAMQCSENNILVMIDTKITEELELEGLSRDVVRIIQQTRKDNGLEISNRINVKLFAEQEIFSKMLNKFEEYVKEQTLTKKLELVNNLKSINKEDIFNIDNNQFFVSIEKC